MGFFIHNEPVYGPTYYYGREMLVRSVFDGVMKGRSFAVCGGPKTGRTSTLMQLEMKLRERFTREPKAVKHVPIRVDLRGFVGQTQVVNLKRLWSTVTRALVDGAVIGDAKVPALTEPAFAKSKTPWELFFAGLADWHRKVNGTGAWCRYILLFDNADVLWMRGSDNELNAVARLLRDAPEGGPYAMVLGGGRYLREHLLEKTALLASLRPLLLGALRESEATSLIRAGMPDVAPDILDAVLRYSGRHPYVMQRLLVELEEHGLSPSVDHAAESAQPDIHQVFETLWDELDLGRGLAYRGAYAAPEHALMQLLLDYGSPVDLRTAEIQLGLKGLKEFVELLEYEGLSERVLRGDVPSLRANFELWNAWYMDRISQ